MTDREKAGLQGLAHRVRTENQNPAYFQVVTFNPEGNLTEHSYHGPNGFMSKWFFLYDVAGRLSEIQKQVDDGPVTKTVRFYDTTGRLIRQSVQLPDGTYSDLETYHYETNGRKSKVTFIRPELLKKGAWYSFDADESNHSHSPEGSTTMATLYDSSGRPVEVLFHDDKHTILSRATLSYDPDGKLLEESGYSGDESLLDELMKLAEFTPQQQKVLAEMFRPGASLARTEYTYDEERRCVEKCWYSEHFGKSRTTFVYDQYGNKTEETYTEEPKARTASEINEEGKKVNEVRLDTGSTSNWKSHYEYEYDPQGNWTRRVTSTRRAPTQPFQVSNTECRMITYYSSFDSLP